MVDQFFEMNLKHLDVTIVSDYVEELELFFIYIKVGCVSNLSLALFTWKEDAYTLSFVVSEC